MPNFTPYPVLIVISSPAGTLATSAKPTLSVSRPDGEHCEPVCTNAAVTVPPPGADPRE